MIDEIKVGDRIRYRGNYGPHEGEVLEIVNERLLRIRRRKSGSESWSFIDGGTRPILRSRVIKILDYNID